MSVQQQVNLLPPELMPREIVLSARQCLAAAASFLVLLLLFGFLEKSSLAELQAHEQKVQQQVASLDSQLAQLQQILRSSDPQVLDRKIAKLQSRLEQRQHLQRALAGRQIEKGQKFSLLLEGLSLHHLNGISISHFRLQQSGYIDMSGQVREAELVPRYINKLRGDDAFQSTRFGTVLVERDSESRYLNFVIGKDAMGESDG